MADKTTKFNDMHSITIFAGVLLMIAVCAMFCMLFILHSTARRSESLNRMVNNRAYCDSAINDLMDASDYLTNEAWQYAADGNLEHMRNYWREVDLLRRRDKALQTLLHAGLTKQEVSRAMQAKYYSDTLIAGETWSMRMLAESQGVSEKEMTREVAAYKLSKTDEALPPSVKRERARDYLLGPVYTASKQSIRDNVLAFRETISERLEANSAAAQTAGKSAGHYAVGAILVMMIILIALIITFYDTVKKKNLELVTALEKAEAASSAKSYFTSRMSHEIRTPLNAVLGYLDIAKNTDDINRRDDCLTKCRIAAVNLINIVNDVLDLSAIENGRMKLASVQFSLAGLISELRVVYSTHAEMKGVRFEASAAGILHDEVTGDRMRTNQVLTNLLSNAVKFTADGGLVTLKAEQTVDAATGSSLVTFTVSDSGIGISPEFLPHVFDPYEQEDAAVSQKFGGTGLGLSIVRNMSELMGGKVEAVSEKDKGSSFAVTLPYKLADKPEPLPAQTEEAGGTNSLEGMKLLLAEDNAMNSEIAQTILTAAGAQVTPAMDGEKAVELFEASAAGSYDAILMDIMMPRLDGYGAARRIRSSSHADAASVPIIAMTANAFASDVQLALDAGMNAHVAKPIDVPTLLQTLAKFKNSGSRGTAV